MDVLELRKNLNQKIRDLNSKKVPKIDKRMLRDISSRVQRKQIGRFLSDLKKQEEGYRKQLNFLDELERERKVFQNNEESFDSEFRFFKEPVVGRSRKVKGRGYWY